MRLVYELGYNDKKHPSRDNGKPNRAYNMWANMLQRCFNEAKRHKNPTYIDCNVSDNFKSFSYFYEWCHKQIGFMNDFELDKDLLSGGSKIYSEDNCVFIPREINTQFSGGKTKHHHLPRGVTVKTVLKCGITTYKARIKKKGKIHTLGVFHDIEEASAVYEAAKREYLKELAEEHKYSIDPRAYQALINY